jgi:hypothetical protein
LFYKHFLSRLTRERFYYVDAMNYIIRDNEIERKRTFHAILLVQKMTDFANTILGNLSALMKHRF